VWCRDNLNIHLAPELAEFATALVISDHVCENSSVARYPVSYQ
jgi:hypothetical protein